MGEPLHEVGPADEFKCQLDTIVSEASDNGLSPSDIIDWLLDKAEELAVTG